MRKLSIIFIIFIGAISLFSCEEDKDKTTLSSDPTAPTLQTSDITLERKNAEQTITFSGSAADFGFDAAVTYKLEADVAGNGFQNAVTLATSNTNSFTFTVSDLNTLFLKFLPEDKTSAVDVRVLADLGIPSTENYKGAVNSSTSTINVTTYGPPKLALTTAEHAQKIVSPSGNKIYSGWVYTDGTAFTFTADDGKVYGVTADGAIVENGEGLQLEAGAYDIEVNLKKMSYTFVDVTVGMIGDATSTGWNDDKKMIWDFSDQTWNLSNEVIVKGGLKFRSHNSWGGEWNVAYDPDGHDLNNLYQANSRQGAGDSQNIDDVKPGTYNIKLSLYTKPMWVTFTPVEK